jgi:cell division protein FtsA
VLTEQEKNMGVVLVDIGHGTTDIAIYIEGSVWHTKIIPIGGWHLTNDLVIVFNIPYEAAEALKLQYGQAAVPGANLYTRPQHGQPVNGKSHPAGAHAAAHAADGRVAASAHEERSPGFTTIGEPGERELSDEGPPAEEMLEAQTFEGAMRLISRGELNEVMAARLDQLFGMISDEVRRSGYEGLLPAGVVLTGGVASMPGIEPLAAHKLRMPVRLGRPQRIGGMVDAFESPAYATTVGLTLWGLRQGSHVPGLLPSRQPRQDKGEGAKGLITRWFKTFLPGG